MTQFQSTPRLATPSLLINQAIVDTDWSNLRRALSQSPAIDRNDDSVQSPLVIKETLESLEQALIDPGDTPVDFMVLATAFRYQFPDRHIRLVRPDTHELVHFVGGHWGISSPTIDDPAASEPSASSVESSVATTTEVAYYSRTDHIESGPQTSTSSTTLVPQSIHAVFQRLCGSRVGLDLVPPAAAAQPPDT